MENLSSLGKKGSSTNVFNILFIIWCCMIDYRSFVIVYRYIGKKFEIFSKVQNPKG